MKTELCIEDLGQGKRIAFDTKVTIVRREDDGTEIDRIDISHLIRAVDVRIRVGEVITAKMECFVSSVAAEVGLLEDLKLITLRRKPWWRGRLRDVTTFGTKPRGVRVFT